MQKYYADICVRTGYYTEIGVQILHTYMFKNEILPRFICKNIMQTFVSKQNIPQKYVHSYEHNKKRYL